MPWSARCAFQPVAYVDKTNLFWLIVTHLTFVLSGVPLVLVRWAFERAQISPTAVPEDTGLA